MALFGISTFLYQEQMTHICPFYMWAWIYYTLFMEHNPLGTPIAYSFIIKFIENWNGWLNEQLTQLFSTWGESPLGGDLGFSRGKLNCDQYKKYMVFLNDIFEKFKAN